MILVTGNSRFLPLVEPIKNVPDGMTDISGHARQSLKTVPEINEFADSLAIVLEVPISKLNRMHLVIETYFVNFISFTA